MPIDRSTNALCIEWLVYVSGDTPTADYEPTASTGVSRQLVEEITELNRTLHIVTEPPQRDALLFFRAVSGQWVTTRIRRNAGKLGRPALEYVSLIVSDANFAKLTRDPWVLIDAGFHDSVFDDFTSKRSPLNVELPSSAPESGETTDSLSDVETRNSAGVFEWSEDSEAVVRRLYRKRGGSEPMTFATWWPASATPQTERFRLIFQSKIAQSGHLGEILQLAAELAIIAAKLPMGTDPAVRDFLERADLAGRECYNNYHVAQVRLHDDPLDLWRERMKSAGEDAGDAVIMIEAARQLLPSARAADFDLQHVMERYSKLEVALLREQPPIVSVDAKPVGERPPGHPSKDSIGTGRPALSQSLQGASVKQILLAATGVAAIIATSLGLLWHPPQKSQASDGRQEATPLPQIRQSSTGADIQQANKLRNKSEERDLLAAEMADATTAQKLDTHNMNDAKAIQDSLNRDKNSSPEHIEKLRHAAQKQYDYYANRYDERQKQIDSLQRKIDALGTE